MTRLCESQRRHGPVAIVTTARHEELRDWPSYRRRLQRAGVAHHTIDFFRRSSDVFWPSVSALADVIQRLRPAVIHAHAGVPSCGVAIARSIAGHPARIIGQMYSWGPGRPEWMNVQDMWGFSQADRVVCSARAYWDLLVRYGVPRRKLIYLPWGLPLEDLTPRADLRSAANRAGPARQPASRGRAVHRDIDPARTAGPSIGFVGRIEPRKGQLELVDAFARVRRRHPEARLDLVGPVADPAYAAAIATAIDRHALTTCVTLTGEVANPYPRIRTWDLFVSLSSDEGQGLAVLEAMALGVPVAARPVAGISDFLVDGRVGFAIVRPGPAAAARTMLDALADPAQRLRMARAARRLVERRYTWPRTVEAFDRLYRLSG